VVAFALLTALTFVDFGAHVGTESEVNVKKILGAQCISALAIAIFTLTGAAEVRAVVTGTCVLALNGFGCLDTRLCDVPLPDGSTVVGNCETVSNQCVCVPRSGGGPPTATPTDTPTDTPTNTPTDTPTSTPTLTSTETPTPTPTPIPAQAAQNLINAVNALPLPAGTANALTSTLVAAVGKIGSGNSVAACNQLNAFLNKVAAQHQAGRLSTIQAQNLTSAANAIMAQLRCET
jgi:hypothetical protein